MTRPEISVGLARRSDVVEIALMSRDLIEKGLRWSWTPSRVAASVRSSDTIVVVARWLGGYAMRLRDFTHAYRKDTEDQRVELKAEWPDPGKAARRIGGHANAARGDTILWLIGVDESRGVVGTTAVDLASWYPQVDSWFDGPAPSVTPVVVPIDGTTIVALLFDTDRSQVGLPSRPSVGGGLAN